MRRGRDRVLSYGEGIHYAAEAALTAGKTWWSAAAQALEVDLEPGEEEQAGETDEGEDPLEVAP